MMGFNRAASSGGSFVSHDGSIMTIGQRRVGSFALALAAAAGLVSAQARDGPDDSVRAVRAVLDGQVADWNTGNLEAFLAGYWHSPKVVFQSGGQRYDGWNAMRERYRRRYQAEGRAMGRLEFSALEIELLASEAALARGRWRLTMPDGTKPGGLFTVILRKLPEGWKIVHDHTSAEEAAQLRPTDKPARE
jgi:beta-aspartyl-peptidase (threonine type)